MKLLENLLSSSLCYQYITSHLMGQKYLKIFKIYKKNFFLLNK